MITRTTNVQGADARLAIFDCTDNASSDFTVFKYGPEDDLTNVFLTPEQTATLAERFARGGGPVPAGGLRPLGTRASAVIEPEAVAEELPF